ncbi:putative F-box protein PP2-B12 [Durio zibethinus]|uniref:F-box protein PP2-B12 n=1 Tax=Durio zibethinus TaxID=66656 RepID=A0A6P5XL97_DURZI|nr:putative F-box protein PP2-B12 [Durio zibethinus]
MGSCNTKIDQRKENTGEEEIGFDNDEQGVSLNELPEVCIANILSATTPADASRFACLSSTFRSAADSDSVWKSFLPSDYLTILSESRALQADSSSLTFSSKKHLFFYLSHNPILIDQGRKSFSLDKWSGKKSYMIASRDLLITWGGTPAHWNWISHPESRFKEVAKLNYVWWLEIRGKISTSKLSLDTNYAAYLVFKMGIGAFGFEYHPAKVELTLGVDEICRKYVLLDPMIQRHRRWYKLKLIYLSVMSSLERPKERTDGWLEIELGAFYNRYGVDELKMSIMEVKAGVEKGGLVVQGIEIRPKVDKCSLNGTKYIFVSAF